jgi:hypothetical protein
LDDARARGLAVVTGGAKELEAALPLTEETGERHSLLLTHSLASLIALRRGDIRRAEAAAALAEGELAATGPRFRSHWASWVRALLLEAEAPPWKR